MDEYQTIYNWLIGIVIALISWIARGMKEEFKEQRQDLAKLAERVQSIDVLVAGTYVKRDDLDKLSTALFTKLDRIEAKVDQKVDK